MAFGTPQPLLPLLLPTELCWCSVAWDVVGSLTAGTTGGCAGTALSSSRSMLHCSADAIAASVSVKPSTSTVMDCSSLSAAFRLSLSCGCSAGICTTATQHHNNIKQQQQSHWYTPVCTAAKLDQTSLAVHSTVHVQTVLHHCRTTHQAPPCHLRCAHVCHAGVGGMPMPTRCHSTAGGCAGCALWMVCQWQCRLLCMQPVAPAAVTQGTATRPPH